MHTSGETPHRFTAQRYSGDTKAVFGDRNSIRDITFSNSVEHGHAISGWLLFTVPKELMDKNGTSIGSLQCRDYLDHKFSVSFGFGFAPPHIDQPPSQPDKGLGAVAH